MTKQQIEYRNLSSEYSKILRSRLRINFDIGAVSQIIFSINNMFCDHYTRPMKARLEANKNKSKQLIMASARMTKKMRAIYRGGICK